MSQPVTGSVMTTLTTLKERLKDWTDFDAALHELALVLGLVPDEPGGFSGPYMGIYWTRNPLADLLGYILLRMTDYGWLEHNADNSKLRWKPGIDPVAMVREWQNNRFDWTLPAR